MWLKKLASFRVKLSSYIKIKIDEKGALCVMWVRMCGFHVNRVWCQRQVSTPYDLVTESNILRLCDWELYAYTKSFWQNLAYVSDFWYFT